MSLLTLIKNFESFARIQGDSPGQWEEEARGVIRDVEAHVKEIVISPVLQSTCSLIYLNLTTLEGHTFTVELSSEGFRPVAKKYDSTDGNDEYDYYNTPYSLLGVVSPAFRESYANLIITKLNRLSQNNE